MNYFFYYEVSWIEDADRGVPVMEGGFLYAAGYDEVAGYLEKWYGSDLVSIEKIKKYNDELNFEIGAARAIKALIDESLKEEFR